MKNNVIGAMRRDMSKVFGWYAVLYTLAVLGASSWASISLYDYMLVYFWHGWIATVLVMNNLEDRDITEAGRGERLAGYVYSGWIAVAVTSMMFTGV